MNVHDHTTSARTPAAGGRFVGVRRRVARVVMGKLWCDQCGNPFDGDECHHCAQRRRGDSGLEIGVSAWGGGNSWSVLDRSDESDGEGWNSDPARTDDEAEGWPW